MLRDRLLKDYGLKLFALVMAIMLWLTITIATKNDIQPGRPLSLATSSQLMIEGLPVVVLSSAEDVRDFRVDPKEVTVTVQGDPKILSKLQKQDIRVLVDLRGIDASHALRKRIEVATPAGVTLVRVEPEEVQVLFPPKT